MKIALRKNKMSLVHSTVILAAGIFALIGLLYISHPDAQTGGTPPEMSQVVPGGMQLQ